MKIHDSIIVTESTPRGERHSDIYSRLLMDRIVFLGTVLLAVVVWLSVTV